MKSLLISTALLTTTLAPAGAQTVQRGAADLPSNYDATDLNQLVLAELQTSEENRTGQQTYANDRGGQRTDPRNEAHTSSAATIVGAVSGDERFSTLTMLIETAGLVDALKAEGPFTVFAPTNEAFDDLGDAKVQYLTSAEGKDNLVDILKTHVVVGDLTSNVIPSEGLETKALNDRTLDIAVDGETVSINGAKVVSADIDVDNGVIHAIDAVIVLDEKA